jgi:hypothetical protein
MRAWLIEWRRRFRGDWAIIQGAPADVSKTELVQITDVATNRIIKAAAISRMRQIQDGSDV